ncbi:MAG: hypothetical protein ABW136_02380 [Steroidobacteraceae bacterium]
MSHKSIIASAVALTPASAFVAGTVHAVEAPAAEPLDEFETVSRRRLSEKWEATDRRGWRLAVAERRQ